MDIGYWLALFRPHLEDSLSSSAVVSVWRPEASPVVGARWDTGLASSCVITSIPFSSATCR